MRHRPRAGFSLIETAIASALLAFVISAAVAGLIHVRKASAGNSLRAAALLCAERTLESLRALGVEELGGRMEFNGVPDNEFLDVWEADAVALGLAEEEVRLRAWFSRDSVSGEFVEGSAGRVAMRQTVSLVSAGDELGRAERSVRVFLDAEWRAGGRIYRESLFTIIR